jgi:diacylglycerol O-acyltransferase
LRQLTSLDAQFLALESARQSGHVGGVAILDPSTAPDGILNLQDMQDHLMERLVHLPPFRWRLAEVPMGMDYPYWVDDADFDIDFHVRELALPLPGSDDQLAEQVARIFSRPLDRSRPLWELYLIHGLPDGNVAMLTKIHHAVVDGISGAEIMGLLLDSEPEGRELPDAPASAFSERTPSQGEMLARGLMGLPRYPFRMLRSIPRALPNVDEVPATLGAIPGINALSSLVRQTQSALRVGRDPTLPPRPTLDAPRTSFNGKISAHRRFVFGQIALAEVKAAKDNHGATVNDTVVSMAAGAVRRWLLEHGELPEEHLVAQVPVSVRTDEQAGTYGNRIMLMSVPLFTNEPDPVRRLQLTHDALADMKVRHKALPAELLQDANNFIPPAVFARAAQLTFRLSTGLTRPAWNLVISNVPGPQMPLYCAGAQVMANYPVSVITDGMGLNITVMSYNGHMDFGIVADRDQMPDANKLMDWLRDELKALKPAEAKKPASPRRKAKAPSSSTNGSSKQPAEA